MINRYVPIGKALFRALPILLFLMPSCAPRFSKTSMGYQKVCIRYQLPKVELDGSMSVIKDSFYMSYFEDFVICESPVKVFHENDTAIIDSSVRYQYFVFKKGNEFGKWFDSVGDPNYIRSSVDSLLRKKALGGLKVYDEDNLKLIQKKVAKKFKGAMLTYVPIVTPDEFYGDTCVLYTTPDKFSAPFSLAPTYDTSHDDKVWKAEIRFRQTFSKRYQIMLPSRAFIFEVVKMHPLDSHDLMKLIHMYENDEYEDAF